MVFLYLTAAIITSGLAGNLYKRISSQSFSASMSSLFPSIWFFPLSLGFFISAVSGGITTSQLLKPYLLFPALAAGAGMAAAAALLIESMKKTCLSISVILVNLNFIIPVVLSAVFLQENAGWLQLIGMSLAVAAILWLNLKKDEDRTGLGFKLILPCIACFANGMVNFSIKLHQSNMGGSYLRGFYGIMYLTAALLCLIMCLILHKKQAPANSDKKASSSVILTSAAMLGICNGVCFYMTGLLAGKMNATAQFTIITAASILVSLLVGFIVQKEPITKKTAVSFLFCLVAILCQASGM